MSPVSKFSNHPNSLPSSGQEAPTKLLLRRPRPSKPVKLPSGPNRPASPCSFDLDDITSQDTDISHYHPGDDQEGSRERMGTPSSQPSHPPTRLGHRPSDFQQRPSVRQFAISNTDKRYIIDPAVATGKPFNTSQTPSSRPNRNALKVRGPDPLPLRDPPKHAGPPLGVAVVEFLQQGTEERYYKSPLFTLNSFMLRIAEREGISLDLVRRIMLSSHNYKKIQEMVLRQLRPVIPTLTHIALDQEIKDSIPEVQHRLPSHQVLLEMTSLIKEHLSRNAMTMVECKVNRLPKYDPKYALGEAPHTEIVVYEKERQQELQRYVQFDHIYHHPDKEGIFSSSGSRQFQDSSRSDEPFALQDQISPGEVCVLDSLMNGGLALSMKANFLHRLPDLGSLVNTLTYVNISYNNFAFIPAEILTLSQLRILKIRNNPLREMPSDIGKLSQLRTIVASFCLLTEVPLSLYTLQHLKLLDLSYNSIGRLHNEIYNLKNLQDLNVDGNELYWMPWGLLTLSLHRLRLRNNFLHPLLWSETARNCPRQLRFAAAQVVNATDKRLKESGVVDGLKVPNNLRIKEGPPCDCCQTPITGPGMVVIRPCESLFGVKLVPIRFDLCSPDCRSTFSDSKAQIVEMIHKGALVIKTVEPEA